MALSFGDRVKETFTTTGTGTISLGGAATGYQAFSAVVANAGTCYYGATDGTNWEIGIGTYTTSGDTLARTIILASSNSGSAVSWGAGTKTIWLDFPSYAAANVVPQNYISGLLCSAQTFSSTTVANMTIGAGQAADSTNAIILNTAGATFTWNITNGNAVNGYSGGTTLPTNATVHFFVIAKTNDTKWSGTFASTSLTPSLPTGYTGGYYRRIFSLNTNGTTLLAGTMIPSHGTGYTYFLATQLLDVTTTTLTTTRVAYTMTVPQNIKVALLYRAWEYCPGSNVSLLITGGDEVDVAPIAYSSTWGAAPGYDMYWTTSQSIPRDGILVTNTSGQIGGRVSSSTVDFYVVNRGYTDWRTS